MSGHLLNRVEQLVSNYRAPSVTYFFATSNFPFSSFSLY